MRNEDVYRDWQQARKKVNINPDFSVSVMDRIARSTLKGLTPSPGRVSLTERISMTSWAKAAAIAIAALIGIGRILLTFHMLLFA
jgi:hypothetical protein